jgi:hypothetical protein
MRKKIIWTYWHQGWENAPSLVKQCKDSWVKFNPDYALHALDQNSLFKEIELGKGIDIQRRDITIQKIAALSRLTLLSKYGGIWTDATVMCTQQLDDWLDDYYDSHFFAFRNPGRDRLMSNWFIAAESDSIILQRLYKNFSDYFSNNYFSNQGTTLGSILHKYFKRRWNSNVKTTIKWHSWFARKILRIYPYFIFHYTFNKLILSDPECEHLWNSSKPFLAYYPHRVQDLEKEPGGIEEAKKEIDAALTPMYKLNWRADSSNNYWKTILAYFGEKT